MHFNTNSDSCQVIFYREFFIDFPTSLSCYFKGDKLELICRNYAEHAELSLVYLHRKISTLHLLTKNYSSCEKWIFLGENMQWININFNWKSYSHPVILCWKIKIHCGSSCRILWTLLLNFRRNRELMNETSNRKDSEEQTAVLVLIYRQRTRKCKSFVKSKTIVSLWYWNYKWMGNFSVNRFS